MIAALERLQHRDDHAIDRLLGITKRRMELLGLAVKQIGLALARSAEVDLEEMTAFFAAVLEGQARRAAELAEEEEPQPHRTRQTIKGCILRAPQRRRQCAGRLSARSAVCRTIGVRT